MAVRIVIIFLLGFALSGCTANSGVPSVSNPETTTSPLPSTIGSSSLPDGFTLKTSSICNISISVPPEKANYVQGTNTIDNYIWRYEEISEATQGSFWYPLDSRVVVGRVHAQSLGSGYNPGNVIIGCNNKTYSSLDTLVAEYKKAVLGKKEFMGETIDIRVLSEERLRKWDQDAVKLTMNHESQIPEVYFVSTQKHSYILSWDTMSEDVGVKENLQKVFDSIQFI